MWVPLVLQSTTRWQQLSITFPPQMFFFPPVLNLSCWLELQINVMMFDFHLRCDQHYCGSVNVQVFVCALTPSDSFWKPGTNAHVTTFFSGLTLNWLISCSKQVFHLWKKEVNYNRRHDVNGFYSSDSLQREMALHWHISRNLSLLCSKHRIPKQYFK